MVCPDQFTDHLDILLHTLSELGWMDNLSKSELTATTYVKFLGYRITSVGDSGYPEIGVTGDRICKLRRVRWLALAQPSIRACRLASIAGQCVAMSLVILLAKLLLSDSYRLLATKSSWADVPEISEAARAEMLWWLTFVQEWNCAPIVVRIPDLQMIPTSVEGRHSALWRRAVSGTAVFRANPPISEKSWQFSSP